MKLNEIAKKVIEEQQYLLIRPRKDQPGEYDYKEHQGKKKGWVILDGITASLIFKIYNALSEKTREHYINQPLPKLLNISWQMAK